MSFWWNERSTGDRRFSRHFILIMRSWRRWQLALAEDPPMLADMPAIFRVMGLRASGIPCHGRACPGHPRLSCCDAVKTWMPGSSPGMTNEFVSTDRSRTHLRDLAARFARALPKIPCPPKSEGAGKAGCALHPRSRVQVAQEVRTRAYRSSGEHPAFPAQWLYGLYVIFPVSRALLPPSLRRYSSAKLGASFGRQNHTISPYARATRVRRSSQRPPHPAPRP